MSNDKSTSGMLEDLLRSTQQLAAIELHAKTALEKADHEMSIAETKDLQQALEKVEKAEKYLKHVTELRRKGMSIMADFAKKLDPNKWCEVKHVMMASYCAFEAYQAEPTSIPLEAFYLDTNKLMIEVVSDFLGLDIPPCAACFSDALKAKKEGDE